MDGNKNEENIDVVLEGRDDKEVDFAKQNNFTRGILQS